MVYFLGFLKCFPSLEPYQPRILFLRFARRCLRRPLRFVKGAVDIPAA